MPQVSEIAFINTLEAQNKKIQVLERHQVRNYNVYGMEIALLSVTGVSSLIPRLSSSFSSLAAQKATKN